MVFDRRWLISTTVTVAWLSSWKDIDTTTVPLMAAAGVSVLRGVPDEQRLLTRIQRNYNSRVRRGVAVQLERHRHDHGAADGCRRRQRASRRSRRAASVDEDSAQLRQQSSTGLQLVAPRHRQVRTDACSDHRCGQYTYALTHRHDCLDGGWTAGKDR